MEETTGNTKDIKKEVQENAGAAVPDMGFGIKQDLEASNKIPFKAGLQKGLLMGVKAYNKTSKKAGAKSYDVLEFAFSDLKGEASYDKLEFEVDREKDINTKNIRGGKELAMNVRIKHIYEAYQPTPVEGLGFGATSWLNYFERIAKAFNTNGKDGSPIFKNESGFIPVHLKFTYFNNQLGLPYSPNFIEKVKEGKETNLVIDLNFDVIKQVESNKSTNKAPHEQGGGAVFGGASPANEYDQFMG